MELSDYRQEIDQLDSRLLALFLERMELVGGIAAWKQKHGMPVLDREREREKLDALSAQSPEELREYAAELFSAIMELSRSYQKKLLDSDSQEKDV